LSNFVPCSPESRNSSCFTGAAAVSYRVCMSSVQHESSLPTTYSVGDRSRVTAGRASSDEKSVREERTTTAAGCGCSAAAATSAPVPPIEAPMSTVRVAPRLRRSLAPAAKSRLRRKAFRLARVACDEP
jgi:hypothetical protein